MPYVQSPEGKYHQVLRDEAGRTMCGSLITDDWFGVDGDPPDNDLAHTCDICLTAKEVHDHTRAVQHPDTDTDRTERKIREMQRQCSQTPKIG